MFIGMGTTLGGTYRVGHIGVYPASSTALAPPYAGNGGTVAVRSDSYWIVGNTFSNGTHGIRTLGTGFGTVGAVTDVGFSLVNSAAPGTHVTGAGSTTNPQVERSGLTAAQARKTAGIGG